MLAALKYYSQLKQQSLKTCPVFIGPNDDIVDVSIRAIEKAQTQPIERITAKDNDAFFTQIITRQSQRNFFTAPPLLFIEGCSAKFMERVLAQADRLTTQLVFQATKLPYKSPVITKLEATGKFIVLTCFDPNPQDLLTFAENYMGMKDRRLTELLPQLPTTLPYLVTELDKIALCGFENYTPENCLQETSVDALCYDFLRRHTSAATKLSHSLANEQFEPVMFLKMMIYQLRQLRDYILASNETRAGMRLSKITLSRYAQLTNLWNAESLCQKLAEFYNLENQMRHHHEISTLVLEQGLFDLFKPSQTKL